MKKIFNKIKLGLATLGITLISFFSKVMGGLSKGPTEQKFGDMHNVQEILYGVPRHPEIPEPPKSTILLATVDKIIPRVLIAITFFIGIVSFVKIRKIDDKTVKKKKIRNAIIIISILVILTVILLLLPRFLNKYL